MRRNKKKNQISILLLLLLGLTIGFAALATTLKINGTTIIGKNTWNVYWANIDNETGVEATTSEIVSEDANHPNNIVNFGVTFNEPGDYYEFTVDAVNAGTIDAEVLSIVKKYNNTVIPEVEDPNNRVVPAYLKYEVTYVDSSAINEGDKLLKANGNTPTVRTVKVRVEFDRDAVTNADINNQVGNVTCTFSLEMQYGQATPSEEDPIAARIAEIKADPDSFRNPQQNVNNEDIGIDEEGNVIDLDWWTDDNRLEFNPDTGEYDIPHKVYGYRTVFVNDDEGLTEVTIDDELFIGQEGQYFTMATASEQIVNGEMITPIPAYIMLAGTNEFYPVTELNLVFASVYNSEDERITKFPKLPNTIKKISDFAFQNLYNFDSDIVIPKEIEEIGGFAFASAFKSENEYNTITFESGSRLRIIDDFAFNGADLSGDLVLPQTVEYIGRSSFPGPGLTSVSFPSSAQYFSNCTWIYFNQETSCDTFDSSITLIQY